MKRILKWLVILLAGVLVLLVVAIGIFAATFDPNAYRDEVAELVKKQTGRELQIPVEIGLTFFPWLGAKIGEVSLGNAPGFAVRTPRGRLGTRKTAATVQGRDRNCQSRDSRA
ncbi:MAG: hypothetical protein AMJ69_01670 [Gammaproteobacteria bacterium SG8_47]|nr:MAG: hypothetical protein AMJ69_01670 [Gammaproteobacteria bacterium SG8_47]